MTDRSRIAPGDFGFEGNEPRRDCSDTGVVGAECASVIMNSSQDLMMVSVQRPGEGGARQQRVSNSGGATVNGPTVVAGTRSEQPYRIGS